MPLESSTKLVPCYQDLVSYVLGHKNYDPHKPVLVDAADEKRSISLYDAGNHVTKLVHGLRLKGIQSADTVCLHMFNHVVYPILFLGIIGAGGRFTGSNPAYTVIELCHHFKASQTKMIITQSAHLEVVIEAAVQAGIASNNIILYDDDTTATSVNHSMVSELMSHGQTQWETFDDAKTSMTTHASLMSTSGTTGLPKMAIKSHYSLVMENQAIEDKVAKPYSVQRLLCVPFFHGFALPLALISALRSGHTTYVMRRFDQGEYLSAIERYHITETAIPPPMMVRFLGMPDQERNVLKKLELIWSGGANMSIETQNRALAMFAPNCRITQVWGMTEGGWMTTFSYPEADFSGSVGRLIGSYEAKIVDDAGQEITEPGKCGEIYMRSQINMLGYYNNHSATKHAFAAGGWLKTGDVATYNDDGKIYIIDRIKELIKVRGWQVAPGELESRLLTHDDIIDAAVIGLPQPQLATEVPRAYVVRRVGSRLSEGVVKSHLLQSLAKYKVQDCEVVFREAIPKSASGKILKKILREEALSGCVH